MKTQNKSASLRDRLDSSAKPWREQIEIHPACSMFPELTEAELRSLADNILANCKLRVPIVIWEDADGKKWLLDGRGRLDALSLVGEVWDINYACCGYAHCRDPDGSDFDIEFDKAFEYYPDDPFALVASYNIHRRHLNAEQKRDVIAKLLKATPQKSNRQIAETVKVDDKTVGSVRRAMEERAEIPHVENRTDSAGRAQPATKTKKRIVDEPSSRAPAEPCTTSKAAAETGAVASASAVASPESAAERQPSERRLDLQLLAKALKAASAVDVRALLEKLGIEWFLAGMPAAWREELRRRIVGQESRIRKDKDTKPDRPLRKLSLDEV
jgi:hypothetical protein